MYWVQTAAIPRTTLDDKSKHIIADCAHRDLLLLLLRRMHKGDAMRL